MTIVVVTPEDPTPVVVTPAGPRGPAGTIAIDEVVTLPAGEPATVENVGTESQAIFNFGIPAGPAPILTFETTITGAPGSSAELDVTEIDPGQYELTFTIPRGEQGFTGPAADFSAGNVTTGSPGSPAEVDVDEVSPGVYEINFNIPEGEQGVIGPRGVRGPAGFVSDGYAINVLNEPGDLAPLAVYAAARSLASDASIERLYAELVGYSGSASITFRVLVNDEEAVAAQVVTGGTPLDIILSPALDVEAGDSIDFEILSNVGGYGFWAQLDELPADPEFTFPDGSSSSPSVHGTTDTASGMYFVSAAIGLTADGELVTSFAQDGVFNRVDSFVVEARTTGTPGHSAPYFALLNMDQTTHDGAGGHLLFQGWNTSNVKFDAVDINGGLIDATAGSESGCADLTVYSDGVTETFCLADGKNLFTGWAVDDKYDFGRAAFRWKNAFTKQIRPGDGSPIWTSGAGTPEGNLVATPGSLYTRTDGGAGTTLYVKETGSGNTGWVAK